MKYCSVIMLFGLLLTSSSGGEKAAKQLVVIDSAGKEIPLASYTFLTGVRPLPWSKGEQCLEFREEKSTQFRDGILTLIPLSSLRKLEFDLDKKTVTALVVAATGDVALTGSTKFVGINKIAIQAEANLGGLGAATIKFRGGDATGIRGLRFPDPRPLPPATGVAARVIAADKEKTAHEVTELSALYQSKDGKSLLTPTLQFQKTVKIDLSRVRSLRHIPAENPKMISNDFEVILDDAQKHVLTLLTDTNPQDGKPAQFVGFVGRAATGCKLIPPHTVSELHITK